MKKKLLSVVLAVVMLVGMISTVAFAKDADVACEEQEQEKEECQKECKESGPSVERLCCCEITAPSVVYTGLEEYPEVTVSLGDRVFDADEYVVAYDPCESHVDVGEYGFEVEGKHPWYGYLVGWKLGSYEITARDIDDENISKSIDSPHYYAGEEITPMPVLVNEFTGCELVDGVDYIIVGYEENIEVGTAYCVVEGIGNFCGQTKIAYEIIPNEYEITKGDGQTVTKKRHQDVTAEFETNGNVNFGEGVEIDGEAIEYGVDYTVEGDEESTKIVLAADFVKSLKDGKHTIEIIYHDASCSGSFNVTHVYRAPKTADGSNMIMWIAIVTAALAATGFAVSRKRRFN